MKKHWSGDRSLFKREVFRNWMIALNRRGGVILLDAMSRDELYRLVAAEADAVISA